MSALFASKPIPDAGPLYRSIVIVDLEGSTQRNNPAKGQLRSILYDLLDRALGAAGITAKDLEPVADRGDGMLILIKPHDDVPKTLLLGQLVPSLTALLTEHNAVETRPELRVRVRAVVHAGEIHEDNKGFYGEDLDLAFRLLEAPTVKRVLRDAPEAPLVLVVSEEIWAGIVRHGYVDDGPYQQRVQVKVGERRRRGRVHLPVPVRSDLPALVPRARTSLASNTLTVASLAGRRPTRSTGA